MICFSNPSTLDAVKRSADMRALYSLDKETNLDPKTRHDFVLDVVAECLRFDWTSWTPWTRPRYRDTPTTRHTFILTGGPLYMGSSLSL